MVNVNTIVIGDPADDTVALTIALSRAAGDVRGGRAADPAQLHRLPQSDGLSVIAYKTGERSYSQMIPPRTADPRAFLQLGGMADGAILLVRRGTMPPATACNRLYLVRAAGVSQLVVVVSGAGDQASDLSGREPLSFNLFKLVSRCGFDPNDTVVLSGPVRGMGTSRLAERLLEVMDDEFVPRRPDSRSPPLFAIDDVFNIAGRGIIATGTVQRGTVRVGDALELVGAGTRREVRCRGIEVLDGNMEAARGGDNVGLVLEGLESGEIRSGMLICAPGSLALATDWKAKMTVLTPEESGGPVELRAGWRGQVIVGRVEEQVAVRAVAKPSDSSAREPRLVAGAAARPVPLEEGFPVILHTEGRLFAVGRVAN